MSNINQKAEKVASAIYLITGFFSDAEPLKWRLRTLSADLVSNSVKDKNGVAKEISSLFSVAKNAGLISDANHDIMMREIAKLEFGIEKPLNNLLLSNTFEPEKTLPEPVAESFVKDTSVEERPEAKPAFREFGVVSVKKNGRQSIIINLLKRKKEIMIKDVTPLIKGCSEKTIQRELMAMVNAGVLKKHGEKRWSRYSLA